ncbi:MAG: hypothetical protein ACREPI_11420 [Candidatus Dormibacterales bacterium]
MSVIDDLVDKGYLESCDRDLEFVQRWLGHAAADLRSATDVVDALPHVNTHAARTLAWQAAFEALAGYLILAGYRPRDEASQWAVFEAVKSVLDTDHGHLFRRLSELRRSRNVGLFSAQPSPGEEEVHAAVRDVKELLAGLEEALRRAREGERVFRAGAGRARA